MKVIEFLRVSTEDQGGENRAGLPRQREANALTAKKHNLSVIKTISIIDVSGTSVMQTPEVQELLSLIKTIDVGGIVVADWDRLIRLDNFRDFALLENFKDAGTLIFLPDQVIDLNTQSGFLIGGFQSIISGNELTQIKKRMLRAKEIKRKNGEHPNSLITLPNGVGYDFGKRKFYYNPEAAKVKRLFNLVCVDNVRNYCELQRLTGFHHRTIPNLLRNEIYIGYRTYTEKRSPVKANKPDGRQADRRKVKRAPDEIIRVKVIDEPLVTEEVFQEVQGIIHEKNRKFHQYRSGAGDRFLYSGFLRCGICGEPMYTTSGGRDHKKDYYYCRTKNYTIIKSRGENGCASSYLRKETVEHTVSSFVGERLTDKEYLTAMIKRLLSRKDLDNYQNEIAQLKKNISSANKKRDRMLDLYGEGIFTRSELDEKVNRLNSEIASFERQARNLKAKSNARDAILKEQTIEHIITTLVEFPYWTPVQKRSFLRSQIPDLSLTKDGVTGFALNFCKSGNRTGRGSWPPPA